MTPFMALLTPSVRFVYALFVSICLLFAFAYPIFKHRTRVIVIKCNSLSELPSGVMTTDIDLKNLLPACAKDLIINYWMYGPHLDLTCAMSESCFKEWCHDRSIEYYAVAYMGPILVATESGVPGEREVAAGFEGIAIVNEAGIATESGKLQLLLQYDCHGQTATLAITRRHGPG